MHILFDIGGTKMRVAGSTDLKTFVGDPMVHATPKRFEEGITLLVDTALTLAKGNRVASVVGGIRGVLNKEKTSLVKDHVLEDWIDKPLAQRIADGLSTARVSIQNDAALGGLGEAVTGAGKGYRVVAYLTVSTGVGGTRVVDGKLDESSVGFEPGKQTIDADQTIDRTAQSGTLEDLVSGSAIKRRFGREPYEIPQEDQVWEDLAVWLSYGLKNIVAYWSPSVIVLGGAMIVGSPAIPLERIEEEFVKVLAPSFATAVPLKKAAFHDFSGLHGSLEYARQRHASGV